MDETIIDNGENLTFETDLSIPAAKKTILFSTKFVVKNSAQIMVRTAKFAKRTIAKTALTGLDNFDAICESFSYACSVAAWEFWKQGNYLAAALCAVGFVVSWVLKRRVEDGPVMTFFKAKPPEIKQALKQLSLKTLDKE